MHLDQQPCRPAFLLRGVVHANARPYNRARQPSLRVCVFLLNLKIRVFRECVVLRYREWRKCLGALNRPLQHRVLW